MLVGNGSELQPVAVSLLQVVADDLALLVGMVAGRPFQPVSAALMEDRAQILGQGAVGGLLDEDVAESEGVLSRQR